MFGPEKFIVDIVPLPKLFGPIIGWTIGLFCSVEGLFFDDDHNKRFRREGSERETIRGAQG